MIFIALITTLLSSSRSSENESSSEYLQCPKHKRFAIVGAGPVGIYLGLRIANASNDTCVDFFEERTGEDATSRGNVARPPQFHSTIGFPKNVREALFKKPEDTKFHADIFQPHAYHQEMDGDDLPNMKIEANAHAGPTSLHALPKIAIGKLQKELWSELENRLNIGGHPKRLRRYEGDDGKITSLDDKRLDDYEVIFVTAGKQAGLVLQGKKGIDEKATPENIPHYKLINERSFLLVFKEPVDIAVYKPLGAIHRDGITWGYTNDEEKHTMIYLYSDNLNHQKPIPRIVASIDLQQFSEAVKNSSQKNESLTFRAFWIPRSTNTENRCTRRLKR